MFSIHTEPFEYLICPISFAFIKNPAKTTCAHVFETEDLEKWILKSLKI